MELRGIVKIFVSLVLLFVAAARMDSSFNTWLILVLTGFGGILWQQGGEDLFGWGRTPAAKGRVAR